MPSAKCFSLAHYIVTTVVTRLVTAPESCCHKWRIAIGLEKIRDFFTTGFLLDTLGMTGRIRLLTPQAYHYGRAESIRSSP